MFTAWVIFHVIVSIALVFVVLMQSSKGEGLAGTAFSGGLSGAVFGGRGAAGFLSKATTVLAIVFMLNCGALAFMSSQARVQTATGAGDTTESAITRQAQEAMQEAQARQDAAQQRQSSDSAGVNKAEVDFANPDTTK